MNAVDEISTESRFIYIEAQASHQVLRAFFLHSVVTIVASS